MGFWSRLFGRKKNKKLNLAAIQGRINVAVAAGYNPDAKDGDKDGLVQDGTIWERPAGTTPDLDKVLAKAEALLSELSPEEAEKKRKRSEAAKKAAATRAAKKLEQVKADAERMAEATAVAQGRKPAPKSKSAVKKPQPKKK
jgi:hypothetical protein